MNFASYNDFRVKVQWLIEGDELENTFSPDVLDTIIGLGEQRVYADLRASTMVASLSLATTNNQATLPADCLELRALYDDANVPIEMIAEDRLQSIGPQTAGRSLYACQTGETLTFWPSAPATVTGSYYQRPADLKTALNSTFNRYPEVFLYASLCCSASVTGETNRIAEWDGLYKNAMVSAARMESQRAYGGSRIRIRAR
jgi:hypothetical protein